MRYEYHGMPLNHVLVGDTWWWVISLLLEKSRLLKVHHPAILGPKIRHVELGLHIVQFVIDVNVGSYGLHPIQDVWLELL